MSRLLRGVTLTVALAGCGGGHSAPARPEPARAGATAATTVAAPAERGPDAGECDALIAHAVTLALADRGSGSGAAPAATADDRRAVEADLRAHLGPGCRELPRSRYRCALAARTTAALVACDADQATRSSSTSNSSVAPGGITPPAPRSP